MMVTYTLQSYDKGIMSAATQFGFNTDLGLTTTIGHTAAGVAITNNQKYSNGASNCLYSDELLAQTSNP